MATDSQVDAAPVRLPLHHLSDGVLMFSGQQTAPMSPTRFPGSSSATANLTFVNRHASGSESMDAEPVVQIKAKRKRISPEQLELLCALFEKTESPSYSAREEVGNKVGMTNREVQVWFQNRRARKMRLEAQGRHDEVHLQVTNAQAQRIPSPGSNSSSSSSTAGGVDPAQQFAFRIPRPIQTRRPVQANYPSVLVGSPTSPMFETSEDYAEYMRAASGGGAPKLTVHTRPSFHFRGPYVGFPRQAHSPYHSPVSPHYAAFSPAMSSPALSVTSTASQRTMYSPFTPATSVASPAVPMKGLSLNSPNQSPTGSTHLAPYGDYFEKKAPVDDLHLAPLRKGEARPVHQRSISDISVPGVKLPSLHHVLDGHQPPPQYGWYRSNASSPYLQPQPVSPAAGAGMRPWSFPSPLPGLPHSPADPREYTHQPRPLSPSSLQSPQEQSHVGPIRPVARLRHMHSFDTRPMPAGLAHRRGASVSISHARKALVSDAMSEDESTETSSAAGETTAALGLGLLKTDSQSEMVEDEAELKRAEAYRRMSIDHHQSGLMRTAAAVAGSSGSKTEHALRERRTATSAAAGSHNGAVVMQMN